MTSTSSENATGKVGKVLIYLDEQKVYSLSSQLFAGFTDVWIRQSVEEKSEAEEQKGRVGSGRLLSDISRNATLTQERRFLHDWAYTQFEQRLVSEGAVSIIDSTSPRLAKDHQGFVRVSGLGGIRDIQALIDFMRNFNELGQSITYVTSHAEIAQQRAEAREQATGIRDRNKRKIALRKIDQQLNLAELAKSQGLGQDEKFMQHLTGLIDHWFSGHLEATARPTEVGQEFVAILNPGHLREDQTMLARKYGRGEDVPLTIFGTAITSDVGASTTDDAATDEDAEPANMREALRGLLRIFANVEATLMAPGGGEVSIDPIAVYTEVRLGK